MAAPNPRLTGTPFFTTWGSKDYGVASGNNYVVQHPRTGFVYVGNSFGVLEFDGATWRLMRLPNEGVVPVIVVDPHGTVWFGSTNAVAVLRPDARGELQPVDVVDRLPPGQRGFGRLYLGAAGPDGIYFASPTHVVFFGYDGTTRTWAAGLTHFNGLCWLDGALHASNGSAGLAQLKDGAFVAVAPPPRSPNPTITDTLRLFAARRKPGAAEAILLTDVGPMRWPGPGRPMVPLSAAATAAFVRDNAVSAAFLHDGRLAFSLRRQGLFILDADGETSTLLDAARGIPRGEIHHLAEDDQGGLWLAQVNGVARLELDSRFATQASLDSVREFLRHGDRLYIAHDGGLAWLDDATGAVHPVSGFPTAPRSLFESGDRVFGTGQYLREATRDDRAVIALPVQLNSVAALPNFPGVFVGGGVRGLRLLHFDGKKWRDDGLVPGVRASVSDVWVDRDGFVWASGYAGSSSWRVDFRAGPSLDAATEQFDAALGLPILRGLDPRSWTSLGGEPVAVRAGKLVRYDRSARRFVPEDRIDNLPGFERVYFSQGENGEYWCFFQSPTPQIARLVRTGENRWRADTQSASPLDSLSAVGIHYDIPTRTLWIGSRAQPVTVNSAWRPARPPPPFRAFIRRLATTSGEVLWGGAVPPSGPQALRLAPEHNSLRVDFAAPRFAPDHRGTIRTVYRSRLEGLEKTWTSWSSTPWREFTNLHYRKFTFQVQARDLEGRESSIGTVAFAIAPPWWATWWFIGIASGSGIAGVAGVSRWLAVRVLKRRLQLLEAQSVVERERLRLARDLHDEVGSGLGRLILFAGEAERAKAEPEKLEASLARVRGAALELVQHAREIVWAVSPQHDTLASVIERFASYTADTLRAAGIACGVELPEVDRIPPVVLGSETRHSLFLAVKEAVHNCVKYSEAKTAELRMEVSGGKFVLVLRDHGRGFAPGELRGSGHGTRNIVARAEALGGSAEISSEVGQGTTVALRIPLKQPRN